MRHDRSLRTLVMGGFVLLVVLSFGLDLAFAKNETKTYPEEGKIVATGLNQYATVNTQKKFTHIYTVVTAAKLWVLDCDKRPVFASTGDECGGDKKLQIGDVIHFRVEKGWAYIPIIDSSSGEKRSREQKLRVLSEELKPDAKPAEKLSDATPETKQ